MKNLLCLTLVFLSFSFTTKKVKVFENNTRNEFEIVITLEDRSGNEIPLDRLSGYYAQNIETNQYYYSGDGYYYGNTGVISSLPAGSYRVGAYDGYFDGASSELVTITDSSNETTEVTLYYWVE